MPKKTAKTRPSAPTDKKLAKRKAPKTAFKAGAEWKGNRHGRKPGSRNRLSEAFLTGLADDFEKNGQKVIETVRKEKPEVYLKVVASVVPQQHGLDDQTRAGFSSFLQALKGGQFKPRAFDPDEDNDV